MLPVLGLTPEAGGVAAVGGVTGVTTGTGTTLTVASEELLPGSGSGVVLETTAVLV
jgi:hypothetical protein